jgi:hypothetical protein
MEVSVMDRRAKKEKEKNLDSPAINGTIPHQVNAPVFKNVDEEERKPFINSHGVVIGDSLYESENSPLNNWSEETDPSIMSGDEWVHPTNDIGWNTSENRELAEDNANPNTDVPFMHPTRDVSYLKD